MARRSGTRLGACVLSYAGIVHGGPLELVETGRHDQ